MRPRTCHSLRAWLRACPALRIQTLLRSAISGDVPITRAWMVNRVAAVSIRDEIDLLQ